MMALYQDQFSAVHDFPRPEGSPRTLVIASTPRCGSHMLGHALHESGGFGFPLEYFNAANYAEWRRRLGTRGVADTLAALQRRRTSPNGVFGIKLHYGHIALMGGPAALLELLPEAHYLLLRRGDTLRQAISLSIASQTGVWIAGQQGSGGRARFDAEHIDRCLRRIIRDNAAWRYLLASRGLQAMEMDFDTVRADLPRAVRRIAEFAEVQLDPARIPVQPTTTRQGGDINTEWRERYLADGRSGELFDLQQRTGVVSRVENRLRRYLRKP